MKTLIITTLLILQTLLLSAQKNKAGMDSIKIKTTAICNDCKERIEGALSYEKGVKSTNLDMKTKVVTVYYKKDKTSPEKIKNAIAKVGYDADEVKANKKAYDKLPACCQRDGVNEK
ncbi:MAG: heavy metal-associated domain-containing protein [Bacteroidetes bacterium]|nr:heavy metal-associated domain-containing protein [Bacteroidota bacterium]